MLFYLIQDTKVEPMDPMVITFFVIITFGGVFAIVFYQFFMFFEQIYSNKNGKPFFVFTHFYKRKLKKDQLAILENQFSFYNKLSTKQQLNFQHRMVCFISDKKWIGKQDLIITEEMKLLVSATAIMLTFGFRKYKTKGLKRIIIYPKSYYSKLKKQNHKGEYNPSLKTLVLSWEDFLEGYSIENDNLNLGIHEMVHVIHFNSMEANDISAYLFKNKFLELTDFLQRNEEIRLKLIETKYFREYAFTNQYEFLSVVIESFFETPKAFKTLFPEVYTQVKQMLNFNYADY